MCVFLDGLFQRFSEGKKMITSINNSFYYMLLPDGAFVTFWGSFTGSIQWEYCTFCSPLSNHSNETKPSHPAIRPIIIDLHTNFPITTPYIRQHLRWKTGKYLIHTRGNVWLNKISIRFIASQLHSVSSLIMSWLGILYSKVSVSVSSSAGLYSEFLSTILLPYLCERSYSKPSTTNKSHCDLISAREAIENVKDFSFVSNLPYIRYTDI